jgi:hypothetical protein
MTDNDKNNIPVIYVHEEDEEDFEREEQRVNALLRKPKKKRTQPLQQQHLLQQTVHLQKRRVMIITQPTHRRLTVAMVTPHSILDVKPLRQ